MFPIEINWKEKVYVNDGKDWHQIIDFSFNNGLLNVAPGNYSVYIDQIPDVYEPLASQQVDVTAEKDKTVEAVFETKQKEEVIPAGHGEVNIRLQIDEYDNDYMGPGGSYIIKDKNGNVLEKDNFKTYTKLYESAIKNDEGKLTGVSFHRANMTILPVGEYTAEITTFDDSLTFESKVIHFKVEENKPKKVIFKTKETLSDVVNVVFEGLEELPDGVKVVVENLETKEKTDLTQSKYFKNIFHGEISRAKYKVTVEVPEGYTVDRETFEITVTNDKVKEVVKINRIPKYGWVQNDDGSWVYQSDDGKDKLTNTWKLIDDEWYKFDKDGKMVTDSWLEEDGKWYYIEPNGTMSKNEWTIINGQWYYANATGRISQNEWVLVNGNWYYANASGRIADSEWILVDGKWYYAESGGIIAQNKTIKIDNVKYTFDADGALVE